jgi:DtxR family Mn-dependent transcriptional regulator
MELTASQEDYLEAILGLIHQTGSARVSDIADRLRVGKSSVTFALRALAKQDLVHYRPYRLVSLTHQGEARAEGIRHRHRTISAFFTDLLGVDEGIAEADACRIEHAVGDGVMRRLSCFIGFVSDSSVPARELPQAFREHCDSQRRSGDCGGCGVAAQAGPQPAPPEVGGAANITLADLQPGEKAKVLCVSGASLASRRLMEMGLTRGTTLTVLRVAPLGDPVEIRVRAYSLSLRRAESTAVEVERVD